MRCSTAALRSDNDCGVFVVVLVVISAVYTTRRKCVTRARRRQLVRRPAPFQSPRSPYFPLARSCSPSWLSILAETFATSVLHRLCHLSLSLLSTGVAVPLSSLRACVEAYELSETGIKSLTGVASTPAPPRLPYFLFCFGIPPSLTFIRLACPIWILRRGEEAKIKRDEKGPRRVVARSVAGEGPKVNKSTRTNFAYLLALAIRSWRRRFCLRSCGVLFAPWRSGNCQLLGARYYFL